MHIAYKLLKRSAIFKRNNFVYVECVDWPTSSWDLCFRFICTCYIASFWVLFVFCPKRVVDTVAGRKEQSSEELFEARQQREAAQGERRTSSNIIQSSFHFKCGKPHKSNRKCLRIGRKCMCISVGINFCSLLSIPHIDDFIFWLIFIECLLDS